MIFMKKIKFQIKGMDCASCASLIEEKLKNRPGIIQVKVNYSSEKASVVYDEEKFKESELSRIIKEAGNFQVEKIPDPVPSLVNDKSDAVKNDAPQAVTRITNSSQASASPKILRLPLKITYAVILRFRLRWLNFPILNVLFAKNIFPPSIRF